MAWNNRALFRVEECLRGFSCSSASSVQQQLSYDGITEKIISSYIQQWSSHPYFSKVFESTGGVFWVFISGLYVLYSGLYVLYSGYMFVLGVSTNIGLCSCRFLSNGFWRMINQTFQINLPFSTQNSYCIYLIKIYPHNAPAVLIGYRLSDIINPVSDAFLFSFSFKDWKNRANTLKIHWSRCVGRRIAFHHGNNW